MAIPSWSLVRVYGSWTDATGQLLGGTYEIKIPARLTNSADDLIIPAGVFATGQLNTVAGSPSLDVLTPSNNDPDIEQTGWKAILTVKFADPNRASEVYTLDTPIANRPVGQGGNGLGVNVRTLALTATIAPQTALYPVGVAGGLAKLSVDGTAVLDASGNPITGSGGGGGGIPDDGSVTDAKVAAAANIAQSKISGLTASLSGKAAAVHVHDAGDVQTGTLAAGRLPAATSTAQGAVELATPTEATTGTDTTRAVTPEGVKAVADTKANLSHAHAAADITSGLLAIARASAGLVCFSTTDTRPTSRTDMLCIFVMPTDPTGRLTGDVWIKTP